MRFACAGRARRRSLINGTSTMELSSITRRSQSSGWFSLRAKRPDQPVAAFDLDRSLGERFEHMGRTCADSLHVQQLIRALSYHSGTRRVSVELRDGNRFDYMLRVPVRPGVPARAGKHLSRARLPRISRLLALALRFEGLIDEGVVRNYRELAEVGDVSRPRLSQIMQLAQLAPDIQEEVLFLPPTLEGPDRVFERQLRLIARVIDWDKQKELFRAFQDTGDKAGA